MPCASTINLLQLSTYNGDSHLLFRGIRRPETAYYNVCHGISACCEMINMNCHSMLKAVTNLSLMFTLMFCEEMFRPNYYRVHRIEFLFLILCNNWKIFYTNSNIEYINDMWIYSVFNTLSSI